MHLTWYSLVLFILASFRLTRLVVHDKITSFIRKPFIDEITLEENGVPVTYLKVKGKGLQKFIGELLSCTWCSGIWCTAILIGIVVFIPPIGEFFVLLLAIAGGAGVIETIVSKMIDG
jgi:hypothetical protein